MSEAPAPAFVTLGQIEAAMLAAIKAAPLGYRLKTVEPYSGQLQDDEFARVVTGFPCALVAWTGEWKAPEARQGGQAIFPRLTLIVGARNMRNAALARQAATQDEVGAGQIVADLRRLLNRSTLGLMIDPLQPTATEALFIGHAKDRNGVVLAIDWLTSCFEPAVRAGIRADGEFLTANLQWDVPPHSARESPITLPVDDADMEATVKPREATT
ncbi:phage protein Gp37 [Ferrovibrio sp.]|uniref:phage protein Gp37 n=1 Tax=Ferrovibrio sp. TaxID=1917215 RepID=UPI0035B3D3A8